MVFGLAVVFVPRQQTAASPLIDLQLFRSVPFSVTLLMMITAMLMGGTFLFISLWIQLVAGLTPFVAGQWLVPQMIAMIIGTQLAPILARRVRPGLLVTLGVLITGIGFAVLSQTTTDGGLATVVIGFTLACGGIVGAVALGTDLVVGSVLEDAREAAQSGITGAAEAAAGLGGAAGERLLTAAGEAFTSGLTTVVTVGAALVLAVVALCSATIARSAYVRESAEDSAD